LGTFDKFYLNDSELLEPKADELYSILNDNYVTRPVSYIFEKRVKNAISKDCDMKEDPRVHIETLKKVISNNWPLFGMALSTISSYLLNKSLNPLSGELGSSKMERVIEDTVEYLHFNEIK